jgi:hypothetical protein
MMDYFQSLYEEFIPLYQKDHLEPRKEELFALMGETEKEARKRYDTLKNPKTSSIDTYIKSCVRYALAYDLAINPEPKDRRGESYEALKDYFNLVPVDSSETIGLKFYNAKREDRKEIWKSFNLPMKEVDKKFKEAAAESKAHAKARGYSSTVYRSLDFKEISKNSYERFLKKFDEIVDFCNEQLPNASALPTGFYSEFNVPCLLCEIPTFLFTTEEEIFDFVVKEHPILGVFKEKIEIKPYDSSYMNYVRETDSFEVFINKNENFRHRSLALIHELSHVVNYLYGLQKGNDPHLKNLHQREKEELQTELEIRKKLSPDIYNSFFCEALRLFWKIIFQIEMYTNPKDNASVVSAQIFNRCFKEAHQKKNYLHVFDEAIVLRPFEALPHAIATAEVLLHEI